MKTKELELFVHGKYFLPELLATWRVLAVSVIFQLIGGALGIAYRPFEILFFCFWYGGVLATLPGMLFGVIWEYKRDPSFLREHGHIVGFYVLIGTLLLLFAALFKDAF